MSLAEGVAFPLMVRRRYAARYFILTAVRKYYQLMIFEYNQVARIKAMIKRVFLHLFVSLEEQVYQSI